MKQVLLDVLACSSCRGRLTLDAADSTADEIVVGSLECSSCRCRYAIENGVPRMLTGDHLLRTRQNFSEQWRLRAAGRFEGETIYGHDPRLLVRWLFTHCYGTVHPGEWMLDAGAGAADKAAAAALEYPDLQVVAMDMSDVIGETRQRWSHVPNLHFVQADVMHLPFRQEAFGKVLSYGVLHHTRSTRGAFDELHKVATPGADMAIWIYPHASEDTLFRSYYWVRDWLFMGLGHRLPPRLRYGLVQAVCVSMMPGLVFSRYLGNSKYRDLDYMTFHKGTLPEQLRMLTFAIYDDIAPEYQFRHKRDEVLSWFAESGYEHLATDALGLYWGKRRGGESNATEGFAG